MKKTLLLILSTVCIASASQSGAEIFKKCGICHGDKGQKHSLNITKFIAGMDKGDVVDILHAYKAKERNKYGLGTMMQGQAAKLSNDDIEAVATYISNLEPVKEEVVIKKVIDTTDGAKIFKQCAVCHGEKGHKRSLNVSKHIAGMKKEDVYDALIAYQTGKRNQYGYGSMMKGQAKKLSDKQKHSVAEYVETLAPLKQEKKATAPVKRISKDEVTWNEFMRWYFDTSTDPNETFKAAKKAWEKRKADIKAGIPVEPIVTKRTIAEEQRAKLKAHAYQNAEATSSQKTEVTKTLNTKKEETQEVANNKVKEVQVKTEQVQTQTTKSINEGTKELQETKKSVTQDVEKKVEETTQEEPAKEEESGSWWSW